MEYYSASKRREHRGLLRGGRAACVAARKRRLGVVQRKTRTFISMAVEAELLWRWGRDGTRENGEGEYEGPREEMRGTMDLRMSNCSKKLMKLVTRLSFCFV